MNLADLVSAQLDLQESHMKDGDPRALIGEEKMDFIRWNVLACEDELHEALAETGWKPWSTSQHFNRDLYLKELVDAFHFFMNLMLVASEGRQSVEDLVNDFCNMYYRKNQINAERQEEGYTGLDKCPGCHRDFKTVVNDMVPYVTLDGTTYCSKGCAEMNHPDQLKLDIQ